MFLDSNGSGVAATAVVERSLFYLNHSDAEDAAIYCKHSRGVQLLSSTVSTNTGPTTNGAVTVLDESGRTTPVFVIESSSIVGNNGIGVKVDAVVVINLDLPLVSLQAFRSTTTPSTAITTSRRPPTPRAWSMSW